MKVIAVLFILLSFSYTHAGVFEVGISTSFKNSDIDADNFTKEVSTGGSISYYFANQSALEFSYTSGHRVYSFKPQGTETQRVRTLSTIQGLDFVYSFAERGAPLQPYVKLGVAQIKKVNYYSTTSLPEEETPGFEGTAPSAGLGIKLKITKTTSIKASIDAWSISEKGSGQKNIKDWDNAGRIGLSWLF